MQLRDYQKSGVQTLKNSLATTGSALDCSDMGTGKTIKALFVAKEIGAKAGIVCPAITKPQWIEAAKAVGVEVVFCESWQKAVRGTAPNLYRSGNTHKSYRFDFNRKEVLWIFDEIHNARNPKAYQTKMLIDCVDQGFLTLMLSATPFENPFQMKGIGHALRVFHRNNHWDWCLRHGCVQGRFGGLDYVGGEATMRDINGMLEGKMDRVRIAEVGDLPELHEQTRSIEVGDLRALNAAYADLLEELAQETPSALTKRLRLRQKIEHEKLQSLFELGEEFLAAGQSVIHFVSFQDSSESLAALHRKAKRKVGRIDGVEKCDPKDFQRGLLDVLVVNYQSGGAGLNLQDLSGERPRTSILNLTDSATNFIQATGRTYRDGSKSDVRFVVPIVKGSVEEKIRRNLEAKRGQIANLVDADLRP